MKSKITNQSLWCTADHEIKKIGKIVENFKKFPKYALKKVARGLKTA